MDKSRDMRRGASRFSLHINKQSGKKLFSGFDGVAGDFVSFDKSKKGKVRKLGAVSGPSKEECEIGCSDLSERKNECPSQSHSIVNNGANKRFKIPQKFFDECNVVDHASVPRKLRSAMKKCNRESVSPPLPDSRRLSHTPEGESPQTDVVNKPKLNLKQSDSEWSTKLSVSGPITKDEEEVADTLYALAGMFPDNDTVDKNKLDGESLEGKPSAPPEMVDCTATAIEVKKDASSVCPPESAKLVPSANLGTSAEEHPDLPDSKRSHMEHDGFIPLVSLNASRSLLAKRESSDKRPPSISGNFHGRSGPSLETGLKTPKEQLTTPTERKLEIAFGATPIEVQLAQEHVIKEARNNGATLWPGLSSTAPLGGGNQRPSRHCATKIPAWLDAGICPSKPSSSQNTSSARKLSEVTTYRKSMKSGAAHVYISRLIRSLQMPESKDGVPLKYIELKHESLKQAVKPHNDYNGVRNVTNGILSGISLTSDRNPYEAGSSNQLQHRKLHRDQQQVAEGSGMHTSQKQTYDFLSLSAGGGGEEINNGFNKAGNALETWPQHQVPYLHSLPPHQSLLHFSMSQARSTSSAYSDQLSVAAASAQQQGQLQLPSYLTSPFYGRSYTSHPGLAKQQLQQRLLAAQFAAQFPRWKNGKHEPPALIAGFNAIIPPSPSSIDAVGPKYSTVPQRQQPLRPISSPLPPRKLKKQDNHPPFVYEESGAGFRAGGALQIQLPCNERL